MAVGTGGAMSVAHAASSGSSAASCEGSSGIGSSPISTPTAHEASSGRGAASDEGGSNGGGGTI
jgi:hypothetical protein